MSRLASGPLFTPEEYLAAHRVCTSPGCLGKELVSSSADPWASFNPTTGPAAAVTLRPPAQRSGRSSTLPPGTPSKWTLGQGKKAVLKSWRSASLPPVNEECDPADYQWSQGQPEQSGGRLPEEGDNVELEDSPWDQQVRNVKKIIGFDRDKSRLSLLETAAYTMARRQVEGRGWAGNLEVGYVVAAETVPPEQLALSPVALFKPEVALKLREATAVNPSFEVHQVKWSRKALGLLSGHVSCQGVVRCQS